MQRIQYGVLYKDANQNWCFTYRTPLGIQNDFVFPANNQPKPLDWLDALGANGWELSAPINLIGALPDEVVFIRRM